MSSPEPLLLTLGCLGAFLCGSIPFGLVLVRLAGKGDVREHGSGNIGATNVSRVGGKALGIVTLLLDIAKGFLPVYLAKTQGWDPASTAGVALAATAGHVFTPWLKFQGGKGVATALGAALAFHWLMVMPSIGLFIVLVALTRYVSLGSILGSALMPLMLALLPEPQRTLEVSSGSFALKLGFGSLLTWPTHEAAVIILWSLLAGLVVVKHHENIRRLLAGTENPLWGAKKGEATHG
ncbi:MAG TPA: glycerol-3-phosphate 1-O-acyltransferase PlsY [Holophagaceae bacterium]|nr:glycerol-3-phosphate 1-O-acyltransferase PlsY [Holophagaceae bacterium]